MLKTKSVLMLVVLSTGLLTVLTGTGVSQVQTAFAEEEERVCENNNNDNCNDVKQKIEQEDNCKIVNKNEDSESGQVRDNINDLSCWNFAQNPEDGDAINRDDAFRGLGIN